MNTWEMFVITNNERNYKLYVHISPSNKRYYGITRQKNVKTRWKNGKGYKNNKYFGRSIEKYGWNNIKHIVLFNDLTETEAKLLEQCYIALYDTTDPNKGYNITLGGEGALGISPSEETRQKLSIAGKIAWNNEERKHNMSEAHKGKPISEEHKRILIKSRKGKHHTEEAKRKMSENHANVSGRNNPSAKSIICITTGLLFFTIKEASEYYNIDNSGIAKCCKGKIKYCGKLSNGTKLVWRYVNYKHNKIYRVVNN